MPRPTASKASSALPRPLLTLAGLALLTGCGGAPDADEDRPEAPRALTETERAVALERGADAAGRLGAALAPTLQERIRTEGLTGAVAFCSLEALPLTAAVTEELGVTVSRTSDRVRNPANAPDDIDRAALRVLADGVPGQLDHHLEPVGDSIVRYYRALYTVELCTRCHGPTESLDPALRKILAERYPDDRATGYREGDFRGVIRVRLPRGSLDPGGPRGSGGPGS